MKTIFRALVAVLVLTGSAAFTQTASASTQNKLTLGHVNVLPVPTCDPHAPSACGMGQH
jgi:hypothetical protein